MPKPKREAIPNELLRYERERRNWTREYVAEKIGCGDAKMVGRWERGTIIPIPYHQRKLVEFYGRSEQELGYPKEDKVPFWHVNLYENPIFTGRKQILQELHSVPFARNIYRQEGLSPQAHRPQVLTGLPGVGKTQIAVAYAHRYSYEYHTIILLDADPRLLPNEVTFAKAVANVLNLSKKDTEDPNELVTEVKNWLSSPILTRWLLIFDNVDSPQAVEAVMSFLPQKCYGHVLLISRMDDPGVEVFGLQRIRVTEMSEEFEEDGATLLLRRTGRIGNKASLTEASEEDRKQALELTRTLDGLPLALDQAGAYILSRGKTLQDYTRLYETWRAELLRYRGKYALGHRDSVAVTFSLCFGEVGSEAQELLRFFAFLAPDAIPEELITTTPSILGSTLEQVANDESRLDAVVENLLNYSLIERFAQEKLFTIHRLVQAVIQDEMTEEEQQMWEERVMAAVYHVFPDIYDEAYDKAGLQEVILRRCQLYLPQALVCTKLIKRAVTDSEQWNITSEEALQLLKRVAEYLHNQAQYAQAELLYQQAADILEKELGPEDPAVARMLLEIAGVCHWQGKDNKAEQLYQRVRAMVITEQGVNAVVTAIKCLRELASLYTEQKRFVEAEIVLQQAKDILSQEKDDLKPDTYLCSYLRLLNIWARLYVFQDKNEDAVAAYKELIAQGEEAPGLVGQSDLSAWYNNLAVAYLQQGKNLDEAETLFRQAWLIEEERSGLEHNPIIAIFCIGLGALYLKQERFGKAEEMYRHALSIEQKIFGDRSPCLVEGLQKLAQLYFELDQFDEALPLFDEVAVLMQEWRRIHLDTARSLHDLGQCHHLCARYSSHACPADVLGHLEEARKHYTKALEMFAALEMLDHRRVATIQEDLETLDENWSSYSEEL